jgi:Ca2+-binding EF-hand superfamily protein
MYTGDAQSRDKKHREKRMQIKQAEEEELRKASVPWHQQEEYKRRQKKCPVADGAAMHDRFDTWQARKQEKVEQQRAKIEEKKQSQSRTPRISSRSKQMQSGRSGNVVESLHRWDAEKKDKLKTKKEKLERDQMADITLTPQLDKSFSKRKDLRDLEADVHGHTASHIRMHAKIRRDAELSPDSKRKRERTQKGGQSVTTNASTADYTEMEREETHREEAERQEQPVPALASSEYNHEFDSRADRLATEMQEAEAMLATGFDEPAEAAFGLSGEPEGETETKHERVVLGGQVLSLPDRAERHALFDRIDYNGNGALSLAEIDKAVVELWPRFDHKRALMRAYKAADRNGDGFIKRAEFSRLLKFIVYFNELWDRFEEIDRNHDHRLNLDEFTDGCAVVGLELADERDAERSFNEIDVSGVPHLCPFSHFP